MELGNNKKKDKIRQRQVKKKKSDKRSPNLTRKAQKFNKKSFSSKGKKWLVSTWEDLDNSNSDEDEEEQVDLCLIADIISGEAESPFEEEVDLDNSESLKWAYHEILSNSFILLKAYNSLRKYFKRFMKMKLTPVEWVKHMKL